MENKNILVMVLRFALYNLHYENYFFIQEENDHNIHIYTEKLGSSDILFSALALLLALINTTFSSIHNINGTVL